MDKLYLKDRTEEVIKKSAIVTNLNDFLATHVPFDKLKYCPSGIGLEGEKVYTEEQIYNKFINENRQKHNFIVVQGDNGSGKSHFIRWLKYKFDNELEDDSEISILIERNYNTLQGTIEQLLQNEIIKRYVDKDTIRKLSEADGNISEKKFLSDINSSFANEVYCEEDDECILNSIARKKLYAFLVNQTVMEMLLLKKGGPIDRIGKKLKNSNEGISNIDDIRFINEDFNITVYGELLTKLNEDEADRKVIKCAEDFSGKRGFKEKVVKYLNSKIERVIQETIKLNTQDLNNMLICIRSELYKANKNLTIFIEDITSFAGLDRAIIENLIVENTNENNICRLFSVVGITQGYYAKNFPDNLKDRVSGRIIIDSDSIFSTSKGIIDVAARYINAIYTDKNKIDIWVKRGALEEELPTAPSKEEWSIYKNENGKEFNLYPFTEKSLINLYEALQEKTPRRLITQIIMQILLSLANEYESFPPPIKEIEDKIELPNYFDEFIEMEINKSLDGNEKERFKTFLRIWGDGTLNQTEENGEVFLGGVSEKIYKHFNIPMIKGNQKVKRKVEVATNKEIKIHMEIESNKTHQLSNIEKKPKSVKVENTEYNITCDDLKSWYIEKTPLKAHVKIRDYIVNILKESIFWEMEDVSQFIVEDILVKNNVIIEDQANKTTISEDAYSIKRNEQNYYFILSLVQYNMIGNRTWNFEGADKAIVNVSKWIEKNKDKVVDFINIKSCSKNELYKVAVMNKYYIEKITNDTSSKTNYEIVVTNNNLMILDEVKKVIGEDIAKLKLNQAKIEENNDLVIRYFNCKLGDANAIGTDVFYLDAKEILEVIDLLEKDKWKFEVQSKYQDIFTKWQKPFLLCKEYILTDLLYAINNRYNEMEKNIKDFTEIFGGLKQVEETIGEIHDFYKNIQNANKLIEEGLYNKFINYYVKNYIMDSVIKTVEINKNRSVFDKIIVLKKDNYMITEDYIKIIRAVEKLIYSFPISNKEIAKYDELNEKFIKCKNYIADDLKVIGNKLIEVNGGGQ